MLAPTVLADLTNTEASLDTRESGLMKKKKRARLSGDQVRSNPMSATAVEGVRGECEMGMSAAVGPVMGATAAEGVAGECEMGDTTEYAPRATNTHRARHACTSGLTRAPYAVHARHSSPRRVYPVWAG